MSNLSKVLFLLGITASFAISAPVTWTLSGVTLADGGTASGSFVYDASTGIYSSINITTTTGSARTGSTYHFYSTIYSTASFDLSLTAGSGDLTGSPVLALFFNNALTNAGGSVAITTGGLSLEASCVDANCDGPEAPTRLVTGGSVTSGITPTPAPPTWLLTLVGVVLLGGMIVLFQRRQRFV